LLVVALPKTPTTAFKNTLFYAFLPHSGYIFVENVFPCPIFALKARKPKNGIGGD
jgi:hypothetical protein